MRKKRTLLVCAACALLAILALLALLAYRSTTAEPSYDGHPLSYWVLQLSVPPTGVAAPNPNHDKATNAIDHIGVAALPFLLKWTQCQPPLWKRTLIYRLDRTQLPLAQKLIQWIVDPKAGALASGTFFAFRVLGRRAMPVFDDLCRLMNQTNDLITARWALFNLSRLGPKSMPTLLAVATNAQHRFRLEALGTLRTVPDLGDPAVAAPALIYCLSDTNNPPVQEGAAILLASFPASPEASVPALVACLKSSSSTLRFRSAQALWALGPQASNAIPALTNALADSDDYARIYIIEALHKIDPVTFTNAHAQ